MPDNNKKNDSLSPVNKESMDNSAMDFNVVDKCIRLADLPKSMEYILREEISDFCRESPRRTNREIAAAAGVHENSVYNAHNDIRFIRARDKLQDIYFRTKTGRFYQALLDAADNGKIGAIKLGLEIAGKHINKTEVTTHKVNDTNDLQGINMDQAVEKFLIMLGSRGWSLNMIAEVWNRLKNQQAF